MKLSRNNTGRWVAALGVVLTLALAGCGSQLSPEEAARAGGSSDSQSGDGTGADDVTDPGVSTGDGGVVPDGGTVPDGSSDPGSAPGTDTGAPGTDTGAPGTDTGDSGSNPGGDGDTGDSGNTGNTGNSGQNSADGGVKAGSCDGFNNKQPGVTDSTITLGNSSDISGPVPGIFSSAQLGTKAFIAYFNASQKLCGHSLTLMPLDSKTDAAADQQSYAKMCTDAFAAVGSMSAFDSGGAGTAQGCGLPDIRSTTVNPSRNKCSTCFSAQSVNPGQVPTAMPSFFLKNHKDATQHVALLYINAGASPPNSQSFKTAWGKDGFKIDYFQGIGVAEFNYVPYIQAMKDRGIKMVIYVGPLENTVRIQQTMQQQNFKPEVFLQDSTIYDKKYVETAGSLANGTFVYSSTALFNDPKNTELKLYLAWLNQVSPGANPNFYGLYAWSAARLFVQEATKLGGKLSRASLVAALKGVHNWTANGLHAPQDPGGKTTGKCQRIIQFSGSDWKQVSPGDYMCGSLVSTGVGG